ncbi:MAG: hypothetical protein QXQ61_02440 [Candidatus Bathyarchaeia archaeon]
MSMLVVDGIKYKLWKPKDEEREFHPIVKEHFKQIFGEDSIYFDIKYKLTSKSGITAIPDAYVITLSKPYAWYIVENELSDHPVYSHIVPQITKFIDSVEEFETQKEIRDILDREVNEDKVLKALIEKKTGQDSYRFLTELVSKPPKIAVIIDEITPEVEKASKSLKKLADTEIIEFKTFVRENAPDVKAHLINQPLFEAERISKAEEKERRIHVPRHYVSWDSLLSWVDDNVKELVDILSKQITELGNVNKAVHGRYLCFYKGKASVKSTFAAFLLTKKALKIRIRTNPNTFRDPQKWTGDKIYKGWFFKTGQEREFKITSKEHIPYAMELIRHSYEISG